MNFLLDIFWRKGPTVRKVAKKHEYSFSTFFDAKKVAKKHEFYDVLFRYAQTDHKIRSKEH